MNRLVLPSVASFRDQTEPVDRPLRPFIAHPGAQMPLFALSAAALLNPYWATNLAAAQPLQPGSYWGGGSRYVTIARQGHDRLCYQGSSQPGQLVVASLVPTPNASTYSIYGMNRVGIVQRDRQTVLLGALTHQKTLLLNPLPYRLQAFAGFSTALKACLNTRQPFYKTVVAAQAMRHQAIAVLQALQLQNSVMK